MNSEGGIAQLKLGPVDPDFEQVVRTSFARQALMATLGARLAFVEPGRVVIELPFSDSIAQQHGRFHGGVIGAIADGAGGHAALSLMPAGSEVLTIEYKINFMKPAVGSKLRAVGQVVRSGKSVSVVRAEVSCSDGDQVSTCAIVQATMMRMARAKPS